MFHLHHIIVLIMVWILVPHASLSQLPTVKDTTACAAYMDSVKLYSYRYDANDSLRYYAEVVLECSKQFGDVEGQMEALSVLGVTYIRSNNYEEALDLFEQNRAMAVAHNDTLTEAQVLINIGSVYTALDSSKKAMDMLMYSAKLFEQQQDSSMLIYVYTNIGILFGKIREREEQLSYSKKAFRIGGGVIMDKKTLTLATNLAVNYLNSGILDSAETLGLLILSKSREFGNIKTTTQILNHLANIANQREDYHKAIEYCNEVLSYEDRLKHDHTFASVLVYRGKAYLALNRVEEAIADLERSFAFASLEKSLQRREMALRHLHEAYAAADRYKDSYRTLIEFKQASDSLASLENVRILNDIETKYETEKKEQQVRDLSQQNQISELKLKQRSVWIVVLLVMALLVIGTIYFISRQRILKQQQEALENRLLSLRIQLNPHFIFNALTAVQNYMLSGKDLRQATRYLSNFAKVMRAFLEYNQEELISLDKEIHALELYVGIQKLRFSEGFEFDIQLDDDINPDEVLVPPMLMQPLIENAIEHGIRNVEKGKITLRYELEGKQLVMQVSDNGIGRSRAAEENEKVADKTSLATKITNERITLLNGKGSGSYSFAISDMQEDGTGTVVTFKIPYIQS